MVGSPRQLSPSLPVLAACSYPHPYLPLPRFRGAWQRVEPPSTIAEKENSSGADKDDVRSAWNNAGTWEEVEKTEWCKGKLTEALRYGTYALGVVQLTRLESNRLDVT